jgi:hypothetical protein
MNGTEWRPFLPTPPFAEYTSGHSTFSNAAAQVLRSFTGSDSFSFSATVAQGSIPSSIESGMPPHPSPSPGRPSPPWPNRPASAARSAASTSRTATCTPAPPALPSATPPTASQGLLHENRLTNTSRNPVAITLEVGSGPTFAYLSQGGTLHPARPGWRSNLRSGSRCLVAGSTGSRGDCAHIRQRRPRWRVPPPRSTDDAGVLWAEIAHRAPDEGPGFGGRRVCLRPNKPLNDSAKAQVLDGQAVAYDLPEPQQLPI